MTKQLTKNRILWRRAWLALLILVFSVLQNTDGLFPQIAGARALIIIPLVTAVSMFERDIPGMLYGLFAGALWDIFASGNNINAIFFVIIGFLCGSLINTVMRNNFVTHIILTGCTALLYCTGYWLWHFVFTSTDKPFFALMRYYFPSFIYTMLLTPAVFFIVMAIERHFREE